MEREVVEVRENLSIRGTRNMSDVVRALAESGYQVLVELDSYQQYQDDERRHYTISFVNPTFEGRNFELSPDWE